MNFIKIQRLSIKSVGKGTGLGLAIARQIVEETHVGKILCFSTLKKGTKFRNQIRLINSNKNLPTVVET